MWSFHFGAEFYVDFSGISRIDWTALFFIGYNKYSQKNLCFYSHELLKMFNCFFFKTSGNVTVAARIHFSQSSYIPGSIELVGELTWVLLKQTMVQLQLFFHESRELFEYPVQKNYMSDFR